MLPEVFVKATDGATKRQRSAAAQSVIGCLRDEFPGRRLLCFLDDQEWQSVKNEYGPANRGFYQPVAAGRFGLDTPDYIAVRLIVDHILAFDDFIYLHGSTCSTPVSLTMTLGHELQHFIQHSKDAQLWAANSLIPRLSESTLGKLGLRWCDIPHEREARIVSKRVAEQIFGGEVVQRHIDDKIAERVTECDAADWECIRGLATDPYDLGRETKRFFPTLKDHKVELEHTLQKFQSEYKHFPKVDLAALLGSDC